MRPAGSKLAEQRLDRQNQPATPWKKSLGFRVMLFKQPVQVARRTGSGTGPTVGATDLVVVLRQVQLGRPAQGFQAPPTIVGGRPKP